MDLDRLDELFARLDPALVVVTARAGDRRDGCLVGFHGQTSIEPRRYGVWLSTKNRTYRVACDADALAVHLLGADDLPTARWFGATTGDEVDPFAGVEVESGPLGTVLLPALESRLVGRIEQIVDTGGDHQLFVLDPVTAQLGTPTAPLRQHEATTIHPGHP